jgi:hypothetical protein
MNYEKVIKFLSREIWKQIYAYVKFSAKNINTEVEISCSPSLKSKLDKLYKGNRNESEKEIKIKTLLLRYETISQGGEGFQYASPTRFYQLLRDKYKVKTECFASPINCYFENYYSAFEDTDKDFNSLGSFFESALEPGNYVANPPFEEEVMNKMSEIIKKCIKSSQQFTFFIIHPMWSDSKSFLLLNNLARKVLKIDKVNYHTEKKTDIFIKSYLLILSNISDFKFDEQELLRSLT